MAALGGVSMKVTSVCQLSLLVGLAWWLSRVNSSGALGRAGIEGMGVQGAEPGGEVPVLHRRQALVLEEEDLVPKQGRLDVRELLRIQRDREIDVLDEGTDGRRQRAGADPGHGGDPVRSAEGTAPTAARLPRRAELANPEAGEGRSPFFCSGCEGLRQGARGESALPRLRGFNSSWRKGWHSNPRSP
jgi:hypothetical protein